MSASESSAATSMSERVSGVGDTKAKATTDAVIRIVLPLPLDMAGTLTNLIGAAYPGAMIVTGGELWHDRELTIRVPDGERRRPKRVTKAAVKAAKAEAAEPSESADLVAMNPDGISTTTPEDVAFPLAAMVRNLLADNPDAANYLEMQVIDREDPSQEYVVIACRSKGQTPHALRMKAEKERDEALAALEAMS